MEITVIPQFELGNVHRLRVGDYLNRYIVDDQFNSFKFAVAYMRVSGLDRIAGALETLTNKGGSISGAVGIDDEITSYEALEGLLKFSSDSTIFYTVSGFIFHPKLYALSGKASAVVIIGSPNLTRDGLFRNVEVASALEFDLSKDPEREHYKKFDDLFIELLDTKNPNIQSITTPLLQTLNTIGVLKKESETREPGPYIRRQSKGGKDSTNRNSLASLFPLIEVPVAPPGFGLIRPKIRTTKKARIIVPRKVKEITTFMMQLSAFDSSHRLNVPGTAEVLIPLAARPFFPALSLSAGRKHPDANFDVVLNTPDGQERHNYRVWFYSGKDEFRLRMDKDTIELSDPAGGDLIVINKLPEGEDPPYEVTILSANDPAFPVFLQKCTNISQDKKWGIQNN